MHLLLTDLILVFFPPVLPLQFPGCFELLKCRIYNCSVERHFSSPPLYLWVRDISHAREISVSRGNCDINFIQNSVLKSE